MAKASFGIADVLLGNVLEGSFSSQEHLTLRKWPFHRDKLRKYGQYLEMACQSTPGLQQSLLVGW